MEKFTSNSDVHESVIQGHYEHDKTDTRKLADTLVRPCDLDKIIKDFEEGRTPLRDVGKMDTGQRAVILEAYKKGVLEQVFDEYPQIFTNPVKRLHARVAEGNLDQPVGKSFFKYMQGFITGGLPWAKRFDQVIQNNYGFNLDIINSWSNLNKDRLLKDITKNEDKSLTIEVASYLAHRSLLGEKYQNGRYGRMLNESKPLVYAKTLDLASQTGLSDAMLKRIQKQMQYTTFGSFDHLNNLITSGDRKALGDYSDGTLRIQVLLSGTVDNPSLQDDETARKVVFHELHHAISAQSDTGDGHRGHSWRIGLCANGHGDDVNEGMTEYLSQLAQGNPDIKYDDHSVSVSSFYQKQVSSMERLHAEFKRGYNRHFAVLFNAYHGDSKNPYELEQALDAFYRYNLDK